MFDFIHQMYIDLRAQFTQKAAPTCNYLSRPLLKTIANPYLNTMLCLKESDEIVWCACDRYLRIVTDSGKISIMEAHGDDVFVYTFGGLSGLDPSKWGEYHNLVEMCRTPNEKQKCINLVTQSINREISNAIEATSGATAHVSLLRGLPRQILSCLPHSTPAASEESIEATVKFPVCVVTNSSAKLFALVSALANFATYEIVEKGTAFGDSDDTNSDDDTDYVTANEESANEDK